MLAAALSLTAGLMARLMPDLGSASRSEQRRGRAPAACGRCCVAHRRTLLTLGVAVIVIWARPARCATGLLPLWADHVGHLGQHHVADLRGARPRSTSLFFFPGGWLMDTRGRTVVAVPVVLSVAVACFLLPLAAPRARRGRW